MTLPPEKIGDKGQRYVLLLEGYPKPGWNEVAYSSLYSHLSKSSLLNAPGVISHKIVDRLEVVT
jgi:hypothetical protein